MLDILDKKIIAAMQDEFPLVSHPYREIADRLGISEDELLTRLRRYYANGQIRKMGAVLKHREIGYKANALCAWIVPEDRIEEIGSKMAQYSVVTHCYSRISQPGWSYNFYTMLHGHSREECQEIIKTMAQEVGVFEYIMLFSTKEWKKSSMRYFAESENNA